MRLIHSRTLNCCPQKTGERVPRLVGIAVDSQDRLLALVGQQIMTFSAEGDSEPLFTIAQPGWSLAVEGNSIWIGMRQAIQKFDYSGNLLMTIADPDRLGRITAIASHENMLLAADATHRTIHAYRDGKWQSEVGRKANTRGFMLPNGVLDLALDTQHHSVVVAHPQKHRVERYSFDGKLTDKFGHFGMVSPGDFGGCCNPTNIATTPEGLIAVSEKAPPRVKLFSAQGEFLSQTGDAIFDANTKNIDLAVDNRARLYATDSLRCVVEVFAMDDASE